MEEIKLEAENRIQLGKKVRFLRREGKLPAVVYARGENSLPVSIDGKEFLKVYKMAGESGLIKLSIGEGKPVNVIISELDIHPVTGNPVHANFRQVSLTEKLTTKVPIILTGESPAVKDSTGIVLHLLNEIEVTCFPQDIPHEIEVDISGLVNVDDAIVVGNLNVDRSKVEIETDPEELVVKIDYAQQAEEVEEAVDEATLVEGVESTEEKEKEAGEEKEAPSED